MRTPRHTPERVGRGARGQAGYTMIEVMMALGVLTVGAVGVVALQTMATRANMSSRQLATANQFAQTWLERLRRDSLQWTRGPLAADATLLAGTTYLRNVPAPGQPARWFVPVGLAGTPDLPAADYYGLDTALAGDMVYCTNVRLEWVYPGRAMRADVRVWFARRGPGNDATVSDGATLAACAGGRDPNALTGSWQARFVYHTTVLRYVPAGT